MLVYFCLCIYSIVQQVNSFSHVMSDVRHLYIYAHVCMYVCMYIYSLLLVLYMRRHVLRMYPEPCALRRLAAHQAECGLKRALAQSRLCRPLLLTPPLHEYYSEQEKSKVVPVSILVLRLCSGRSCGSMGLCCLLWSHHVLPTRLKTGNLVSRPKLQILSPT